MTPTGVSLEPMVPNTAYAVVPTLRDNWVPEDAPPAILAGAAPFDFFEPDGMDEVFVKAVRLFQYGLLDGQNALNYGVPSLRHEAPRRLRVRGRLGHRAVPESAARPRGKGGRLLGGACSAVRAPAFSSAAS